MKKIILIFIGLSWFFILVTMEKPNQQKLNIIVDQPSNVAYCDPEIVDKFNELSGDSISYGIPFVSVKIAEIKKPLVELIEKYGIPITFLYNNEFILHDKDGKYQIHFKRGPNLTDSTLRQREGEFMLVPLIAHLNTDNMSFKPGTSEFIEKLLEKKILKKIEKSAPVAGLQHEHGDEGWLELKEKIVQDFHCKLLIDYIRNNESEAKIEHLLLYNRR